MREGNLKLQDELSTMFSQGMHFSNVPGGQGADHPGACSVPETKIEHPAQEAAPISYSISQHYHHSAHMVSSKKQEDYQDLAAKDSLIKANIDPSCLLKSQITLFKNADEDQKARLIELWRISPPNAVSCGAQEHTDELWNWQNTTIEQEEEMARLRYMQNSSQEQGDHDLHMDHQHEEMCSNVANGLDQQAVEPYITSGYEHLAQRDYNQQRQSRQDISRSYPNLGIPAETFHYSIKDVVYQPREWWQGYSGDQPMEHQYGMFTQSNHFNRPAQALVGNYGQEDEEML